MPVFIHLDHETISYISATHQRNISKAETQMNLDDALDGMAIFNLIQEMKIRKHMVVYYESEIGILKNLIEGCGRIIDFSEIKVEVLSKKATSYCGFPANIFELSNTLFLDNFDAESNPLWRVNLLMRCYYQVQRFSY